MYHNKSLAYLEGFVNPVQILTTTQCHLHSDNNTMSSAYSKQETNLPMRSRGSQSFPKLSAKSLIYKEKRVGSKYSPVLHQY